MRLRLLLNRKNSPYKTFADFDSVTINGHGNVINLWQDGKIDTGFVGDFDDLIATIEAFFEEMKKQQNLSNRLFVIFYDEDDEDFKYRGV